MDANPLNSSYSTLYVNGVATYDIEVPRDITVIKDYAFNYGGLKNILLHDSITSIGDYAFYYTRNLQSISIPSSVTSIGVGAFEYSGIKTIDLSSNSVITIGNEAFKNSSLNTITIPDGAVVGRALFYGCNNLEAIYSTHSSEDNRCLIINGELLGFARKDITSYSIPTDVINITESVFRNYYALTDITIPDSVTTIESYAFTSNGLTSVTIPASISNIGSYAFASSTNLSSVFIKAVTPPTGYSMFDNCSSDLVIYVPSSSVNAYKSASGWSSYADKIVGYVF